MSRYLVHLFLNYVRTLGKISVLFVLVFIILLFLYLFYITYNYNVG